MPALIALLLVSLVPTATLAKSGLPDQQIAAVLVRESRQAYYTTGHPCACPDDHMLNGRRCGRVSAYSRPGGASPLCYPSDVPRSAIEEYRRAHQ